MPKLWLSILAEFERIDKVFSESFFKFPSLRTKPYRSGGITIRIESVGGKEPKIEIRTTGEYKKLEPEIKKRLGMKPAIQEVKERKIRVPKVTEEPETKIKTIGNKQIITVKLPGVKSEDDIEIRRLEQSIEIKAFVNNKAYFTLIPIPKKAVISKKFKEGVLKIEIRK